MADGDTEMSGTITHDPAPPVLIVSDQELDEK